MRGVNSGREPADCWWLPGSPSCTAAGAAAGCHRVLPAAGHDVRSAALRADGVPVYPKVRGRCRHIRWQMTGTDRLLSVAEEAGPGCRSVGLLLLRAAAGSAG